MMDKAKAARTVRQIVGLLVQKQYDAICHIKSGCDQPGRQGI
jgi:hypothetical protein